MADSKITELTELTSVADADVVAIVDDPAGVPVTKKITKANLVKDVAVSSLANGTDGELITWDSAGAPTTVPTGTATQVLTSNGAGAAPTFQDAAGGGGEAAVWQGPNSGFYEGTGVSVGVDSSGMEPVLLMTDGSNNQFMYLNFRVPDGADGLGISKIEVIHKNKAASALNINGQFKTRHYAYSNGGTRTEDTTGSLFTSTSPSTAGQTGIITAPANSFNALPGTMSKGDVLSISFARFGAEAEDTYGQTLQILGMMVTFA